MVLPWAQGPIRPMRAMGPMGPMGSYVYVFLLRRLGLFTWTVPYAIMNPDRYRLMFLIAFHVHVLFYPVFVRAPEQCSANLQAAAPAADLSGYTSRKYTENMLFWGGIYGTWEALGGCKILP